MKIDEMHVWFRQYAQQMGMQNVRAILPEQIDILINTSITDTINQLIRENIGITNDRVITDNSKLGQINALQPLYKVKEIPCFGLEYQEKEVIINFGKFSGTGTVGISLTFSNPDDSNISLNLSDQDLDSDQHYLGALAELVEQCNQLDDDFRNNRNGYLPTMTLLSDKCIPPTASEDGILAFKIKTAFGVYTDVSKIVGSSSAVHYSNRIKDNITFTFNAESVYSGMIRSDKINLNYLFLVDFALNYVNYPGGIIKDNTKSVDVDVNTADFISNYFPVRLIDDAFLADTVNDFILKNRLRSPILTIYNNRFDLYIDKFVKKNNAYYLDNGLVPYMFRVSYIAKPAIVKYSEDLAGQNVDCDLPEYMHIDILKHAVDLYRVSVNGSLHASQQAEQAQQQENVRNNYRNEGN